MKKLLAVLLTLTMVFSFAACGGGGDGKTADGGDSGEKIVFKIAHQDSDDAPSNQMLQDVEKYVEEKTDGKVDIQLYPNGIMGSDREVLEGIQLGTVQMSNMGSSVLSTYGEKFSIFEIPFLYKDFEAICNAYDGELGEIYNDWLAEEDFLCLGILTYGWKGLSNNVRPVSSPADMTGMKVRVMEVPMYIDTFKALGANPTAMSWNEIYTGLQQGTIEAQDNSPELTYTAKFHEVQKYYTNLNHVQGNGLLLVKKSYFESLPEDVQTVIQEAFDQEIQKQRARSVEDEQMYIQNMIDEGIQFTDLTDEQRAKFSEKVTSVHDHFREVVGDEVFDLALSYSK